MTYPDGQGRGPRPAQASLREEPGQIAFPDTGQARLVARRRVQLARRPPEQGQRAAAARVIPHAGRDRPARTGDPAHLAQARHRIGHEMND